MLCAYPWRSALEWRTWWLSPDNGRSLLPISTTSKMNHIRIEEQKANTARGWRNQALRRNKRIWNKWFDFLEDDFNHVQTLYSYCSKHRTLRPHDFVFVCVATWPYITISSWMRTLSWYTFSIHSPFVRAPQIETPEPDESVNIFTVTFGIGIIVTCVFCYVNGPPPDFSWFRFTSFTFVLLLWHDKVVIS